jgi:hypothetical protein
MLQLSFIDNALGGGGWRSRSPPLFPIFYTISVNKFSWSKLIISGGMDAACYNKFGEK